MRVLLAPFDYPAKEEAVVGRPNPEIVGPAAQVHESGEDPGHLLPRLSR